MTVLFYNIIMHPKDSEGMANSVDPDQTAPKEEQSDLGLHYLLSPICHIIWNFYNIFTFDQIFFLANSIPLDSADIVYKLLWEPLGLYSRITLLWFLLPITVYLFIGLGEIPLLSFLVYFTLVNLYHSSADPKLLMCSISCCIYPR